MQPEIDDAHGHAKEGRRQQRKFDRRHTALAGAWAGLAVSRLLQPLNAAALEGLVGGQTQAGKCRGVVRDSSARAIEGIGRAATIAVPSEVDRGGHDAVQGKTIAGDKGPSPTTNQGSTSSSPAAFDPLLVIPLSFRPRLNSSAPRCASLL